MKYLPINNYHVYRNTRVSPQSLVMFTNKNFLPRVYVQVSHHQVLRRFLRNILKWSWCTEQVPADLINTVKRALYVDVKQIYVYCSSGKLLVKSFLLNIRYCFIFTCVSTHGATRKTKMHPHACLHGPHFLIAWNIQVLCNLLWNNQLCYSHARNFSSCLSRF